MTRQPKASGLFGFKIPKAYIYLAFLFLLPRLLYLAFYIFFPDKVSIDNLNHHWIASDWLLREGKLALESGISTTQIEPLYPIFLAFLRAVTGDQFAAVLFFQILFSLAGCLFFYELCRHFLANSKAAFLAAVIYACSPYYIRSSVKIIEVSFFRTLLVMTAFYSLDTLKNTKSTFKAAFFWGLSMLTRSMVFPGFLLMTFKFFLERQFRQGLLFFALGLAVCSPMFFRNYRLDGSLFPTRGGLNFFISNCKYYSRIMPLHHVDNLEGYAKGVLAAERPDLVNASDRLQDQFYYRKTFQFIHDYPWRFLKFKALNLAYFFTPLMIPIHPLGNSAIQVAEDGALNIKIVDFQFPGRGVFEIVMHTFFRGMVLMLGVMGFLVRCRQRNQSDIIFLILFVNFLLVYTLFWPSTRLYSPVMFVLIAYAGYALKVLIPPGAKIWQKIPVLEEVLAG